MASKKKVGASKAGVLGKLESVLLSIEDPKPPPIPTDRLIAEGFTITKLVTKYTKELKRVGLNAALLSSIEGRTKALAESQANVAIARKKQRSAAEVKLEAAAVALRAEMVADGRYALRDDEDAQAAIDRIQEGEGLDDLVQDLRALVTLASENKSALARIGVKSDAKTKQATSLAAKLADALANRRTADSDERQAVAMRDRAATYLLAAIREVREAGTYAFRGQPEILARFRGAYAAQARARSKAKAKAKGASQGAPNDLPSG